MPRRGYLLPGTGTGRFRRSAAWQVANGCKFMSDLTILPVRPAILDTPSVGFGISGFLN